jgi:hypothetical protein
VVDGRDRTGPESVPSPVRVDSFGTFRDENEVIRYVLRELDAPGCLSFHN